MHIAAPIFLLMSFAMASSFSAAAQPVALYAAGSLRAPLTDISKAFAAENGTTVETKFGPSGTLKDEIAGGAPAGVFASANMEHPQALQAAGKSGPVTRFARNALCALVRSGLSVDSANLLDRMLDPTVKLGTSTPKADPSGDYAFDVFGKAEKLRPGARAILAQKALQLTGSATSMQPPRGRAVYGWHVAEGRADIFLAYCTAAREAKQQNPDQQIVALPDNLAVAADYGLTVINGAPPAAAQLAAYILSPAGQRVLASYGFGAAK